MIEEILEELFSMRTEIDNLTERINNLEILIDEEF